MGSLPRESMKKGISFSSIFLSFALLSLILGPTVGAKHSVACEHGHLKLACQSFTVIQPTKANYGRLNSSICGHQPLTTCRAPKTLEIVKKSCEGKKACIVKASNKVFGDPCPWTYKYLEVDYECGPGPDHVVACELNNLKITCKKGTVIQAVKANYGRLNAIVCGHQPLTTCRAPKTLEIVKKSCDGKETCTVKASNSVFGDPCPWTYKYLEVDYECRPAAA